MAPVPVPRYTLLQDAQGLIVSTLICAFGLHLLRSAGLVTGGTAGLALLLSYATGWSFGLVFFTVNLPFYILAWLRRGPAFTLKSMATVTTVSALAEALPPHVVIAHLAPFAGAVLFGVVAGVGLLGLFRHSSSLGGVSIVALIVQDRWGIRAGWVQLGFDAVLFLIAFAVIEAELVLWSLLGAAVLNFVIAMNHRREWYLPT